LTKPDSFPKQMLTVYSVMSGKTEWGERKPRVSGRTRKLGQYSQYRCAWGI